MNHLCREIVAAVLLQRQCDEQVRLMLCAEFRVFFFKELVGNKLIVHDVPNAVARHNQVRVRGRERRHRRVGRRQQIVFHQLIANRTSDLDFGRSHDRFE
eukprot:TRINITY_DN9511_c0_g1_i1.p1 TRINITY_DN9511_c0_g1~~TRINITY_DN9511_c0_g1_i1.p1  ORF type:complete len:100 (-),score=13.59 TRINITY_DN9511_c0_g1_i1:55-354(-)